jgi:hypothetical protein
VKVKDYDKIRDGTCLKFLSVRDSEEFLVDKVIVGGGGGANVLSGINNQSEY